MLRSLIILLTSALLTVAGSAGVVFAVDYDGLLGTGVIPPMDPAVVVQKNSLADMGGTWDLVILGSSHIMWLHPTDLDEEGVKALNLGTLGSTPEMTLSMWRRFEAAGGSAHRVLVGFDDLVVTADARLIGEHGRNLSDHLSRDSLQKAIRAGIRHAAGGSPTRAFSEAGGWEDAEARFPALNQTESEAQASELSRLFDTVEQPNSDIALPWLELAESIGPQADFVRVPVSPFAAALWSEQSSWREAQALLDNLTARICDTGATVHDLREWRADSRLPYGFWDSNHLDREASLAMLHEVGTGARDICHGWG